MLRHACLPLFFIFIFIFYSTATLLHVCSCVLLGIGKHKAVRLVTILLTNISLHYCPHAPIYLYIPPHLSAYASMKSSDKFTVSTSAEQCIRPSATSVSGLKLLVYTSAYGSMKSSDKLTVATSAELAHFDCRRENDMPFTQSSSGRTLVHITLKKKMVKKKA